MVIIPKVVVLGAAAMDLLLKVKRFPKPDENILVDEFLESPGGSAANVAVGLARLGIDVGFMGKLGDDRYGWILLEDFRKEGVDTKHVYIKKNAKSAFTIILINGEGERIILSVGGASLIERPEEVDENYLKSAQILYLGLSFPEIAMKAIHYANEVGALKVFCLEETYSAWGKKYPMEMVKKSDIISVNGEEAMFFTNSKNPIAGGKKLLSYGPKAVIVTLGAKGCAIIHRTGVKRVPAFKSRVIDTTGAGDAFNAGLIAGLLDEMNLEDTAKFGSAAAAINMSQLGARSKMPTRAEVQAFLKKFG